MLTSLCLYYILSKQNTLVSLVVFLLFNLLYKCFKTSSSHTQLIIVFNLPSLPHKTGISPADDVTVPLESISLMSLNSAYVTN